MYIDIYTCTHTHIDRKKPAPPGGCPGCVVFKPRTRMKRTPLEKQPLKLINIGGCCSGGVLFVRVLGLETTQQRTAPREAVLPVGGGFLRSIYIYIYTCMYVYIYIYMHIYVNTYTYIYIYTHMYIYTHTYMYTYIHIYMCMRIFTHGIYTHRHMCKYLWLMCCVLIGRFLLLVPSWIYIHIF